MKRFIYLAFILAIFTFVSCKKSAENADQNKQQDQADGTKAGQKKGTKRGGGAPVSLQIFQEDKLVATVPPDQYNDLVTADIKIDGKDHKAILLSDLMKKYNLAGKTVTLGGPAKQTSITWEQATANPIYVYLVRNHLQLYTDSKNLETVKLPQNLIKLTTSAQPPAAATPNSADQTKGQKKTP